MGALRRELAGVGGHVRGLPEDAARSPIFAAWEPRMTDVWKDFLAFTAEELK